MMHYAALVLRRIRAALVEFECGSDVVKVDNIQGNCTYGVQQARITLADDPLTYRLIIAPADAPITINGRPIGEHFAMPLGDR